MDRVVQVLAQGFHFGECPRWHDGRLWFSDFFGRAVLSVSLAGDLRREFAIHDQPAGLGWMPNGDMLVVSMIERKLLRRTPAGEVSLHADLSDLATFHCNDMVVDDEGRAYVGNFGFNLEQATQTRGLEAVLADHPTASVALVSPQGDVSVAASGLHFPNGSVITSDGSTFIVGETLGGALTAFSRNADGTLGEPRLWASTWPRVPDGIALDENGRIWFANPLTPECVLMEEGGRIIDIVETRRPCFACMLGGEDRKTLFMLTAPFSGSRAAAEPHGELLYTQVNVGGSGNS